MSRLQQLMNEFERKGDQMDSFEADHLNAMLMTNGVPAVAGRQNMGVKLPFANIHPNSGGGDKAQFDIQIQRLTANIAQSLEVPIFGATHDISGYVGVINPATGGSFSVAYGTNNALPNALRITHVVGAGTDIIQVTCNQLPYPAFLEAMRTDMFRVSNIRYSINDTSANGLTQFSEIFEFRTKSLFGKADQNPISVLSFKKPENFQAGIIDLPVDVDIWKDRLAALSVNRLFTGTITLSVFIEAYAKRSPLNTPMNNK